MNTNPQSSLLSTFLVSNETLFNNIITSESEKSVISAAGVKLNHKTEVEKQKSFP